VVLAYVDPNLRPALKFYQQLKPLLRAMRNGLVRFAIGYGFTIFIFAGLYMALYRTNASNFQFPTAVKSGSPDVWDFIYFSVTTLVSVEFVIGVFWIVVYFAVAMTLLQVHARRILNPSRKPFVIGAAAQKPAPSDYANAV
jgi:hypothetical protein